MKVGDLVRSLQEWRENAFGIITGYLEGDLWRVRWIDPNDKGKEFLHRGEWCAGSICRGNYIEVINESR